MKTKEELEREQNAIFATYREEGVSELTERLATQHTALESRLRIIDLEKIVLKITEQLHGRETKEEA